MLKSKAIEADDDRRSKRAFRGLNRLTTGFTHMSDDILYSITCVLLAVCTVKVLFANRNISRSISVVSGSEPTLDVATAPYLVIVICALREEAILDETAEFFLNLSYPPDRLRILFVTTEREYVEPTYTDGQGTPALASLLANKHARILHLHYPDASGQKPHQMNYAVRHLPSTIPEWSFDEVFLGFYDADSRPNPVVLSRFAVQAIQSPHNRAFQHSAVYLGNFLQFKKHSILERFILQALAARQTRFAFAYEIPRIQRVYDYSTARDRALLSSCTYAPCIAHGLFVKHSLAEEVPFPTHFFSEDMAWGFLMAARQEPIALLGCVDWSEIPASTSQAFAQMARWFQGPYFAGRYVRFVREEQPHIYERNRRRINLLYSFALYDAFVWLVTFPLIVLFAVMSFKFGLSVLVPYLIFLSLYELGAIRLIRHFIPRHEVSTLELMCIALCIPLALVIYSSAGIYGCLRTLGRNTLYGKTERSERGRSSN
jgi:cellulose synthase/poly-beta-1,6-N-acetylglucosamine synthase-like glycosyltransferase